MKKRLALRAEHLTELTTIELDAVVGASTTIELPHTVRLDTCSLPC